jgi:hypothetical protein
MGDGVCHGLGCTERWNRKEGERDGLERSEATPTLTIGAEEMSGCDLSVGVRICDS